MALHTVGVGVSFITEDRWGSHGRLQGGIPAMSGYGAAVKDHLPMMKQMIEKRYGRDEKNRKKCLAILEKMAKGKAPKLISIAPYIEETKK